MIRVKYRYGIEEPMDISYEEMDVSGSDDALRCTEQIISALLTEPSSIVLDFADIHYIVTGATVYVGSGKAEGANKYEKASQAAMDDLALKTNINEVQYFLATVGSSDVKADEIKDIMTFLSNKINIAAELILGTTGKTNLGNEVEISIIAALKNKRPVETPQFLHENQS